jgi:hypothetical protein
MWRGWLLVWVVVVFEELGKTIDVLLTVMMMEGKRKAQDHEAQKPFDSGV